MRKISYFNFNSELLVTSALAAACLLLYVIFPANNIFQKLVSSASFLLVIPFLYGKIVLKKNLKDFGLTKGNWQTGIVWSAIALLISTLVLYLLFQYFAFSQNYSLPQSLFESFSSFLFFEILLVGFFNVLYEFFFRGFLMFSFVSKIGIWSIFLQAAVFLLIFLVAGGVHWTLAPSLIFLIFSGAIAYFSRSIIYSLAAGIIFNIILDSFFIYLTR